MTILDITILTLAFTWSGFVRGGLGFGGTALMLPFALLVVDSPLEIIPLIIVQSLVFSTITVIKNSRQIDYCFIIELLLIIGIPIAIGLIGLITLPNRLLMTIVFVLISGYAIQYIHPIQFNFGKQPIDRTLKPGESLLKKMTLVDFIILAFGSYMMGVAFSGSPVMVAILARYTPRDKLRNTLFILWALIAAAKVVSLLLLGINMHFKMQLWLFPATFIGHLIGTAFHKKMLNWKTRRFYQVLGSVLLTVIIIGLIKTWI